MENIYEQIAERTGGDIYIGVVGPVRTGKSTFIKRFMDSVVLPKIENIYMRERARDELPQSGSGRTIMTAEPKFVPEEAVEIKLDGSAAMKVRLIDCVGYMVDGALGQLEDDVPLYGHDAVVGSGDPHGGGGRDRHAQGYHRALDNRPCHHDGRQHHGD